MTLDNKEASADRQCDGIGHAPCAAILVPDSPARFRRSAAPEGTPLTDIDAEDAMTLRLSLENA
jgi:hypothetical protein